MKKTMVNKRFWLGMLVIVLAFGMTVVEVEAQSNRGGEFTLTNIPAKYDGKYAIAMIADKVDEDDDPDGDIVMWAAIMEENSERARPVRIKDGKAILPLWINWVKKSNGKWERYSGNHSLLVYLKIWDEEGITLDRVNFTIHRSGLGMRIDNRVNFSNGNATKSYNDRDVK
jgi:hypothetical protein